MLFARPTQSAHTLLDSNAEAASLQGGAVWLDLLDPTDEDIATAERLCAFSVPTRRALSEIESTSRVRREGDTLFLSMPLARKRPESATSTPVGIVVAPDRLLTIRWSDFHAFDTFAKAIEKAPAPLSTSELLLGLLEAIVDRLADVLELAAADLDHLSTEIFAAPTSGRRENTAARLRRLVSSLGASGDALSMIRDSLLGVSRILLFIGDFVVGQGAPHGATRLQNLERDRRSLTDFDEHVMGKIQFLLDATLGLINIDQNNGIRILTVVSIVGIPPTLIASIYGMNFKDIPELNWSFGYYYALSIMVLSVFTLLFWFRRMRWI